MAGFARDITSYKYFRNNESGKRDVIEQMLQEEKHKAISK